MNHKDIIRMAREAECDEIHASKVLTGMHFRPDNLERFAALVAAAEREACAKRLESMSNAPDVKAYAAAIRAREQE
jgi:hypothetical protein